jgi:hypothetical protein
MGFIHKTAIVCHIKNQFLDTVNAIILAENTFWCVLVVKVCRISGLIRYAGSVVLAVEVCQRSGPGYCGRLYY